MGISGAFVRGGAENVLPAVGGRVVYMLCRS